MKQPPKRNLETLDQVKLQELGAGLMSEAVPLVSNWQQLDSDSSQGDITSVSASETNVSSSPMSVSGAFVREF